MLAQAAVHCASCDNQTGKRTLLAEHRNDCTTRAAITAPRKQRLHALTMRPQSSDALASTAPRKQRLHALTMRPQSSDALASTAPRKQ